MNTAEHERAPGGGAGGRSDQGGTGSSPTLPQSGDIPAEATPYQLLPPLSADEYAALVASIAADGIRVPIQVDEHGVILDGHHRAQIAAELGIDCPQVVVSNLDTEAAKRTVALSLNLSRRHLNREQTRQVVAASITADPDLSDREHARRCGCSPTTVGTVRKALEVSKLDTEEPARSAEEIEKAVAEVSQWVDGVRHWLNLCYTLLARHGMPEPSAWHLTDGVWQDLGTALLAPDDGQALSRFDTSCDALMGLVRVTAAGGAR